MEQTPLQRALHLAPERSKEKTARPERELFLFRIGELYLGIDSSLVREVTRLGPLTPLPRSASFLLGVAGQRGEVLPVVDLLRFFGQGELRPSNRTRIFIGLVQSYSAAFVADQVIGLRKVFLADVLPAPVGGDVPAEHVQGVVQIKGVRGTVTILDFVRVMASAQKRAVTR